MVSVKPEEGESAPAPDWSDSKIRERRLLRKKKMATPAISAIPTTPPTMPPAMAPVVVEPPEDVLKPEGAEVADAEAAVDVAPPEPVDWA